MLMSTLSPKARALIEAGRKGYRPAEGDRARIEAALGARLLAAEPTPAARPARSTRLAGTKFVLAGAVGACLVGAVFLGLRHPTSSASRASEPVPSATLTALAVSAIPAELPPIASAFVSVPALPSSKPSEPAPSSRAQDSLAQEVALLSRATSALRAGHPELALQALSEHQRRFPHGVLSEERRGAKAQALCAAGRVSEGRAQLAQLAAGSPAAARAKQLCDAGASTSGAQ